MYNIIDYLKYYKDCSLEENHWNRIDNLLCALLVYLPIKPFKKEKALLDFYNYAKEYDKPTKEILTPYCTNTSDILGKEDINNLLTKYPEVEKSNYKLWLTSTTLMDKILHSKVYNQSEVEIDDIRSRCKLK